MQVYDIEKHWWGLRMVELGHRVLYMDSGEAAGRTGSMVWLLC